MFLYHYFDEKIGPFKNISDLSIDDAKKLLNQNWNDDGKYGPERYIEVHVWSDETIKKYNLKFYS